MADNSCPCQVKRESMEIIFELLIQFLLEMFVQGGFELGFRGMLSIFGGFGERKDEERFNPWLAVCGYIFMGRWGWFDTFWQRDRFAGSPIGPIGVIVAGGARHRQRRPLRPEG